MENNQEDSIKRVEKRLYSSRPINAEKSRSTLSSSPHDIRESWEGGQDISTMKKDIQTPILRTLLYIAIVFFLSAMGISAYLVFVGTNIISSDNIDLSLSGPVSVKGGEEFDLQVMIANKNNIPLLYSQLNVEYPEGAGRPESGTLTSRHSKKIGEIGNNSVINEAVKSVLYGEENSEQEIKVTLEYRTEGSNATFVKKKSYKTFISTSPLSLTMDLPSDTNAGKDMNANVVINSNSSELIKDVILEIAYPSGFIFKNATPPPAYGDNMWVLGDILAKGQRSIHLSGVLQGQDGEVKTFRASAGTRGSKDGNKVTVIYGSSLKSLLVKKPYIGLSLAVNGDAVASDYSANSNEIIRGDVTWINNLPVKILDGQLAVKLNGVTVNKSSVSSGSGIYKSAENVIVWDKLNGNFPQSIEPGQSSSQSFSFSFVPLISGGRSIYSSPSVELEVKFSGTRFAESRDSESIVENVVKRTIKIASDLQLTARALYYAGPFKNTGPLPPTHDKETKYTLSWSIINSSNDVSGATVKANLPSYVKWLGVVSPDSEHVTYDQQSGEVIWNVGNITAGSGTISKPREVAFQISFTPSISQIQQYPILISDATVSGTDSFTNIETRSTKPALNIQTHSDPGIKDNEFGAIR